MNAFHVLGGLLAVWALVVSFLGVTREGFPGSKASERLVSAISVLLVVMAISAALITSAAEEGEESEGGEEAALVLPPQGLPNDSAWTSNRSHPPNDSAWMSNRSTPN